MDYLTDQMLPPIKEEFVDLDGLPADVLTVDASNSSSKTIILLIPGNPGIVRYYSTFIQELHKELRGSSNIWTVSHSCHSIINFNKNDFEGSSPLNVEIEHKLRFLEQRVPQDWRITLIGHSIGCYMILSLLEILSGQKSRPRLYQSNNAFSDYTPSENNYKQLFSRIDKCYFLFPTIERMRVSPNGKRLWPVLNYLQSFIVFLITLVSWLPHGIRFKIASLALSAKCSDHSIIESTVNLITPRLFGNMLRLAYDELSNVDILDINSIQTHRDKLVFYFGTSDRWCPLSYRNDLIQLVPDLQNYVDGEKTEHAFVLTHSRTMAVVLARIFNRN